MKQLLSVPIGGDGGAAALQVDAGFIQLVVKYPVDKITDEFVKKDILDKIAKLIPGTWDDALLNGLYVALVAYVKDQAAQPEA